MTTTPTLWGTEITFSFDTFAAGARLAALADGTFIITWESQGDIFGRHLDELGSFTGGNFLSAVSAASTKPLSAPIPTQQVDGRVVINYRLEFDDSPLDRDVYWHSPNATYTPHSSVFGTEKSGFDEILLDSTARAFGDGGAIVYNYTGPGDASNLVLRFTDAIGNQASNQIFIDPSATRQEQNPALAGLHTGFVAVAYESVLLSGTFPRDIRLRVYTPGELDVSGEVIVSAADANAAFPDIVKLLDGSFVITWQQTGGVAFRRYIGNGTAADATPLLVPSSSGAFLPQITALKDGGFIIAWTAINGTESDGSPDLDIFLRRFNSSGNTVGTTMHLDKPGDQGLFGMTITTLSDGRVLLAYANETGDSTNLFTQNYQFFDSRETTINGSNSADNIVGREEASTIYGLDGNDKLTGRAGADFLIGGTGIDTTIGGTGNDTYYLDNALDVVKELAGQGTDNVFTTVSYTLAAGQHVELLGTTSVAGTAAITLRGNELGQRINGNNGNNILYGGAGNDVLIGYAGNDNIEGQNGADTLKGVSGVDKFVFRQSLVATSGADHISDFGADDFIFFDHPSVTGPLNPAAFVVGANALDANDRFIYYAPFKALYFDQDGNGAAAKVLFAVFDNGYTPTAADIVLF